MTDIRIVRDYPHPPAKVWRALTDPALIALWGCDLGIPARLGTRFRFFGKANPRWRGFVECELLEVRAPSVLRYSWVGNAKEEPTYVTFTLEPYAGGTRVSFEHAGFTGASGFLFAKLMMGPGWRKMFGATFPAVLADLDDAGALRPTSTLKPKF
jgi:uncharacterized protein YndB with AHSA1/START domain